jgi:hypothetical protein
VRGVDTGRKVRPGDGQERAELDTVAIEPPRDPKEPAKPVANLSGRHGCALKSFFGASFVNICVAPWIVVNGAALRVIR